jgi:hypothetical protein
MPAFIPGIDLNRAFYAEVVRSLLAARFPDLAYSAALIGYGSDVLGYDTERSTDHEWGPRLLLFLRDEDFASFAPRIDAALRERLPPAFRGHSTAFTAAGGVGIRRMGEAVPGAIDHHIQIFTVRTFVEQTFGLDLDVPLHAADWLALAQQQLLELTAGAVYHDGIGTLVPLRERFAYYPDEVWVYLLVAGWTRIAQEEAFMGRCGELGDDLGSRILTARLVRDLMRLCFLIERRYAPYAKWLGTAFARLDCAGELGPLLSGSVAASAWREREDFLCQAYQAVAWRHNALGLTPPLDTSCSPYYGRPYRTLFAERFASALTETIGDGEVREVLNRVGPIGGIDQWVDSTDLLDRGDLCARTRLLYTGEA